MQWLLSNLNPMLSSKPYPKMAMSHAKKSNASLLTCHVTTLGLGPPRVFSTTVIPSVYLMVVCTPTKIAWVIQM